MSQIRFLYGHWLSLSSICGYRGGTLWGWKQGDLTSGANFAPSFLFLHFSGSQFAYCERLNYLKQ